MRSNLRLLLGIAIIFGVSTGLYEYTFPLFLDARGMSTQNMGIIFAFAGLAMLLVRIYMGGLADVWGRKPLYGWALLVCGGATVLVPVVPFGVIWQAVLKTFREVGALTRETVYPVVLYEEEANSFLDRYGKFRGLELLGQAAGTLLVGVAIGVLGSQQSTYRVLLIAAGSMMMLAVAIWQWRFSERHRPAERQVLTLRDLCSFAMHRNLLLILIAGVIFNFGVQLSHSFYLPLFFIKRFDASVEMTAAIMFVHRLTFAVPMLIVGNLPLKNLRAWYCWGLVIQGVTVAVAAVTPVLGWSVAVFMLHDLIGAGIWSPIQATLIQRYSRGESRALEVGKVLAWSSLGAIAGPLTAGVLAQISTILPFLASGVVMALSAIPLIWLNANAPEPNAPAMVPEAA